MRILCIAILSFFNLAAVAFAHGGHVGELAGHSHLIGLAAGVAALALAALLARNKGETSEEDEDCTVESDEDKISDEPASVGA